MLDALRALGVAWREHGCARYDVAGAGGPFPVKHADLFLGLSGPSMRTLVAALAFCGGDYRVDGVPRMRERPIGDLVDALRPLGADDRLRARTTAFRRCVIGPGRSAGGAGRDPRRRVEPVPHRPAAGAAAARADVTVAVDGELISRPYVEITLNLMRRFGVTVERDGWRSFRVPAGDGYRSPGRPGRRRRRVGGVLFPGGRRDGRRAGAGHRRGPRFDPGRRRVRRRARRRGADVRFGPDWIEARAGGCVAARSTASRFPTRR